MNEVNIIQDWGDYLAVEKPAGWLTIPGRTHGTESPLVLSEILGTQLRQGRPRQKENDLFPVHRLDIGTSGVVLFAKTPAAHKWLNTAFENGLVKKTYWCLINGTAPNILIDKPLLKLPSKKNKTVVSDEGKPSQTKVRTLNTSQEFSVVEAQPLTGRTHQIRVHLASIGFPIIGDKLYGGAQKVFQREIKYPLLHCREMTFEDQLGKSHSVSSQPSGDFIKVLMDLGLAQSCSIKTI